MTDFVVGLAFSMDMQQFVLIKKRKESRHFGGLWNGVGGRIQEIERPTIRGGEWTTDDLPETPHAAMSREFQEETGIVILHEKWHCFYIQNWAHTKNKVYWMYAATNYIYGVKTITDEEVKIWDFYDLIFRKYKIAYDLHYIMNMIQTHVKAGDIFCLNPEGVNIEKKNPDGVIKND